MSTEETTPGSGMPTSEELRTRGMIVRTGFFHPDTEPSAGAKRQQTYRDKKRDQGLEPVNLFAPRDKRARKAIREMAAKMNDGAYVTAAERLAAEPAAVAILTGPVMDIARAFVEPANDNFADVAQRALGDDVLRDHLTTFAALDENTRSALLAAGEEEGGLLLRAAQRATADATFRTALARLVDEEQLAWSIVAAGITASVVLQATTSEKVRTVTMRAAEESGFAEHAAAFADIDASLRGELLLLAQSARDLVHVLATTRAVLIELRTILASGEKRELLNAVARANGAATELFARAAVIAATPEEIGVTRKLMNLELLERRALALIDSGMLVRYFIKSRRGENEVASEASKLNWFVAFLTQLKPEHVDMLSSAEEDLRTLAVNQPIRELFRTLRSDERALTLMKELAAASAAAKGISWKHRLAAARRIFFTKDRKP